MEDENLRKSLAKLLLQESIDKFGKEKEFCHRMYLSDVIADWTTEESIYLLGKAMRLEADVYQDYGEYPRERLVNTYKLIARKNFSEKIFINKYGTKCTDSGLISALSDYVHRFASDEEKIEMGPFLHRELNMQKYDNKKWNFLFYYPKDWIIITQNTTSGTWDIPVTIGNKEGSGGPADFMVAVKKYEVLKAYGDNPNITVTNYCDDGTADTFKRPSTPSEYLQSMKKENNISESCIISEKENTVAEYPAIEYTFYEPTNKNVTSRVIIVFGKGITFQFKCQTPSAEFKKFNYIFTNIISTFKII